MEAQRGSDLSDLDAACPLAPRTKKVKPGGPFKRPRRSRTWAGRFQKQLMSFRFPPFLLHQWRLTDNTVKTVLIVSALRALEPHTGLETTN